MRNRLARLSFTSIFLAFGTCTLFSKSPLSPSALYHQSTLWPPKTALVEDFKPSSTDTRAIPAGREAVVIRMESDDPPLVLLDFGRLGLHRVPIPKTDFRERAEKIASAALIKETPNWTMMIGRGFSRLNPVSGASNVPLTDLEEIERFLVVYLDGDKEVMRTIGQLLSEYKAELETSRTLPVIFGTGDFVRVGEATYLKILRENGLSEQIFMVPHISVPYARSMAHEISQTPGIVLVDTDGKTLHKPISGDQEIHEMFSDLAETLAGLD